MTRGAACSPTPTGTPIPGTSSIEHLEHNVAAASVDLTDEDLAAHILADTTLTDKQKRALLEVYLSFRRRGAAAAGEPEAPADATETDAAEGVD